MLPRTGQAPFPSKHSGTEVSAEINGLSAVRSKRRLGQQGNGVYGGHLCFSSRPARVNVI